MCVFARGADEADAHMYASPGSFVVELKGGNTVVGDRCRLPLSCEEERSERGSGR